MYNAVGPTLDADTVRTFNTALSLGGFLLLASIVMAIVGFFVSKGLGFNPKTWSRVSFFSDIGIWSILLAGKARDNDKDMEKFNQDMEKFGKVVYYLQIFILSSLILVAIFFYLQMKFL